MWKFSATDRDYLRSQQYRDGSNLTTRMTVHERFSTNPVGWHSWVFDQIGLEACQRVLEVGTGMAALWQTNCDRLPNDCAITLSDLSTGMLTEARRRLGEQAGRFCWTVLDIQSIPCLSGSFDVVIANHMLYHVPNREQAFAEIRRVLAEDGSFYAATNGGAHMRELDDLLESYVPEAARDDSAERFSLENGERQLKPYFPSVVTQLQPNGLEITDPDAALSYLMSTPAREHLDERRLAALRSAIERKIEQRGAFHVSKESGLFACSGSSDLDHRP
jgi:SAM-dependent methyltransferase